MTAPPKPTLPVLFCSLALDKCSDDERALIAKIDDILPQTQCGLCGHHDGCLPYAYGIVVVGEAHNLCVPGGQAVTDEIFKQLAPHRPTPVLSATPSKWQTNPATNRPQEVRAVIDESECIGCTKCLPACPVDAIIGTAKHMHTIITDLCTGCELCLPPCPVDCISLVPHHRTLTDTARQQEQAHLKKRYHQHLNRVAKTMTDGTKPVVNAIESAISSAISTPTQIDKTIAKNTIELAKIRTQIKKLTKQLAVRDNPATRQQLNELNAKLTALSHD